MTSTIQSSAWTIPNYSLTTWRSAEDPARAAEELVAMCHGVGFFTITDHGVPAEFVAHYFDLLERFFALPEHTKALIDKRRSPWFRGWERVGAELTNGRVDHREQIDLSTENSPYPPDVEPVYLRLDGPNQWLPDDVLPGFREAVDTWLRYMGDLAWELMEIMSVGLGLPQQHLRDSFGERPLSLTKLISYPRTPPGEAGVNPHKDAGFLTFVAQRGVGGLEALAPDGQWIAVDPPADAFVVNVGEMLQAMTANYFVAATHRVVATEPRFSAAYFHGPDLRTAVEPLPLPPRIHEAVAASPRHRDAGFMAKRNEILDGETAITSAVAPVFGQMLWNYYSRSYPEVVEAHFPGTV
jgi:isopenicillin N synthase-like dioxygenase